MRTPLRLVIPVLGLFAGVLCRAATLPFEAPLHLRPEAAAPVVGAIAAGGSITALLRSELEAEGIARLPTGWVAIRHEGPLFGYAPNSDVGKDLALKPGAIVRAAPTGDGAMLAMITAGDRAEVVSLEGDWSKVVFSKPRILFLNTLAPPPPAVASAPGATTADAPSITPGPAAPTAAEPAITAATPRVFQGYLMRTRRILGAGPRLDHQLVDAGGGRIALLDLGKLLVTDPLDTFEGRRVGVFGPASRSADGRDLVIRVETLRLAE